MKSEDLFRAMNGIPDELLVRSEEDTKKTVAFERRKRVSLMFLSTAAMGIAAGLLLMTVVRPMMSRKGPADPAAVAAAQEQQEAAPAFVASAEEEKRTEGNYTASYSGASGTAFDSAAGEAAYDTAEAEEAAYDAAENDEAAVSAKSSADLLGDRRGDYVKIEYIAAADRENGGTPVEIEYSEEGERILSRAFSEGETQLALFGVDREPLFYIYLTASTGRTDEVIVYDGGYATISTKPGFRLKLPEDVMTELVNFLNQ